MSRAKRLAAASVMAAAVMFHPLPSRAQTASALARLDAGRSGIARLEIESRTTPAFGGKSFGATGQYELLVGKAYALADPRSVQNAGLADLDNAPVNGQGLVEYSFDIMLLKPLDLAKANGTLVYEVANRGRPLLLTSLVDGDGSFAKESGAGSTFVLEQGYTLAWSGWQADIGGSEGGDLKATFPVATDKGAPLTGMVRDEFALDGSSGAQIPAVAPDATSFEAPLYYPLAHPEAAKVRVTVRERADDAPRELAPDRVRVTGPQSLNIAIVEGFDRGALYEVEYDAKDPKVMGLSFASIRDLVSFLRHSPVDGSRNANPLAPNGRPVIERTIAIGLSQSGRFQRDFIYQDFNVDEAGRRIFDGMIPQGAGAKRGFFNARFAEPGRSPDLQHEMRGYPGASFPFTYGNSVDLVTRRADGILNRCTVSASCPKVMQIDSDWEQWQQAGSLVVSDELGRPVRLPDDVRAYMVASAPHASLPPRAGIKAPGPLQRSICEQPMNPLTWAPVLRALVRNMDEWVKNGTAPPASRYPAGDAEGRVTVEALRNMFPAIPGFAFSPAFGKLQLIDFSRNPPETISRFAPYAIQVMRVNADGNGQDGVVLPEVAVPIATYSGRNTRAKGFAQGELCHTLGASIPFAKTAAERQASGDPRPSIAERYRDVEDYRAKLTAAAQRLVSERLMLPRDAEGYASFSLPQ